MRAAKGGLVSSSIVAVCCLMQEAAFAQDHSREDARVASPPAPASSAVGGRPAPRTAAPPAAAPPAPAGAHAGWEDATEAGVSLIVFGGTTLALGVGTLVYVAQDQSGMKDLSDGPIAALSVLGIAAGLPMVLGGIAVLSSEGPDGEPTVKAAVGPTWVGIEGTF